MTEEDLQMLDALSPIIGGKKYPLPPPTICPEERERMRLAQTNHINLYERTCDLSGEKMISSISPDKPFKVYKQEQWYSDRWDPLEYGKEFDFSRPFFDQFKELSWSVPKPALFTAFQYDENCAYTNNAGKNKNCYLIFDSDENRDCYYSYSLNGCVDCSDCYRARKCTLCCECIDCVQCYESIYLQDCENCSNSAFLKNCIGCKNCLMCSNLRNKEYYVENKKVTPEQFAEYRALLGSRKSLQRAGERFAKLKLEYPQKYIHGVQIENVVGDYLVNSKNAYMCFDSEDLWDCRYVYQGFMPLKNCMDLQECGEGERLYNCSVVGYNANSLIGCDQCLQQVSDLLYCTHCFHCTNCFGCSGLRNRKYCIFNKQYTKEAYDALAGKMIEHMQKTNEWGQCLPMEMSMFGYNESTVQEYFPLTKQDVEARGWMWSPVPEQKDAHPGPFSNVPDDIGDTTEAVCKGIYQCPVTKKAFKIVEQELELAQKLHIPLPVTSFFQRHKERMALRNPRKLWKRTCSKCSKEVITSYAPERPEEIVCEECYAKAVY
ncbi:hypothetical protein COU76_00970 [Candidatus Peregrinibacteria bacterium CG10_big_fil_rev_8_21_14_0_10_49_10]|nr:MAG: hypothetical protein COU76_00970 [Candidatus Peregrinibacteria bacterium CG10_big_fil_rev_8_21_14_0_10_49_10]